MSYDKYHIITNKCIKVTRLICLTLIHKRIKVYFKLIQCDRLNLFNNNYFVVALVSTAKFHISGYSWKKTVLQNKVGQALRAKPTLKTECARQEKLALWTDKENIKIVSSTLSWLNTFLSRERRFNFLGQLRLSRDCSKDWKQYDLSGELFDSFL